MGIKAGLAVNYPINDKMAVGLDVNFLMHGKSKPEVDGNEIDVESGGQPVEGWSRVQLRALVAT